MTEIKKNKFIKVFTLAILTLFLGFLSLYYQPRFSQVISQDIEEYQEEIEEKEETKAEKKEILGETQSEIDKINESNMSISSKISALDEKVKEAQEDIESSENNLKEKAQQLEEKEVELDKQEEKVKSSSTELYKNSQIGILEVLLNNTGDIFKTIQYRSYLIRFHLNNARKVYSEFQLINEEKEEIENETEMLKARKSALDESMVSLENEKARLEQEMRTKLAMENSLKQDIMRLDKDLANLTDNLQQAILDKVNQTEAPEQSGGGNTEPPVSSGKCSDIEQNIRYDIYIDGVLSMENLPDPIRLVPKSSSNNAENVFQVNGSLNYRGILEFRADSDMCMINEIPFEKYLYGLGEVPSSWPDEVLKAQAVAGRGYAAKNWSKRNSKHYNLRDDTYDQNYTGYNKEKASYGSKWVSAVNATQGQVLKSGGSIISAYYHSTCGGHTLSSQEKWGGYRSYAQAESDWYETDSGWKSYDKDSPWSFKRWGNTDINYETLVDLLNATLYLSVNPDSSTRQNNIEDSGDKGFSPSEMVEALGSGNTITDKVGTITDVKSVYNNNSESISSSARFTKKLRVYGTGGTSGNSVELSGSVFRIVFNARSPGSDHIYYSTLWTAVKERENVWNFYTRGYPHRVGMCQYGAYGRAKAGQNYEQILTHYYRGTSLSNFTPSSSFRVGITRIATGTSTIKSVQGGAFDIYSYGTKVRSVGADSTVKIVKK